MMAVVNYSKYINFCEISVHFINWNTSRLCGNDAGTEKKLWEDGDVDWTRPAWTGGDEVPICTVLWERGGDRNEKLFPCSSLFTIPSATPYSSESLATSSVLAARHLNRFSLISAEERQYLWSVISNINCSNVSGSSKASYSDLYYSHLSSHPLSKYEIQFWQYVDDIQLNVAVNTDNVNSASKDIITCSCASMNGCCTNLSSLIRTNRTLLYSGHCRKRWLSV